MQLWQTCSDVGLQVCECSCASACQALHALIRQRKVSGAVTTASICASRDPGSLAATCCMKLWQACTASMLSAVMCCISNAITSKLDRLCTIYRCHAPQKLVCSGISNQHQHLSKETGLARNANTVDTSDPDTSAAVTTSCSKVEQQSVPNQRSFVALRSPL